MSHTLSPWVHSNFSDRTWDIQVAAKLLCIQHLTQLNLYPGRYCLYFTHTSDRRCIWCQKSCVGNCDGWLFALVLPLSRNLGQPAKRYYGTRERFRV
ncbi:hypothetical protein C8255_26210 [filamentous cyanobacterium CCP3]|nr:hypothetical protein C8255_26210 [filamentous cyanobacterium CCP3]